MRSPDTAPAAHRVQVEIWRRMGSEARLALALQMSDDLRATVADGVRLRNPRHDAAAVARVVHGLWLGESADRPLRGRPSENP